MTCRIVKSRAVGSIRVSDSSRLLHDEVYQKFIMSLALAERLVR
jgi:hypothetical protein